MSQPSVVHPDPAALGEISGRSVVLAYTSVAAEYEALRKSAIVVDRSHRGRLRMSGERAGEMLTGLVTNDVLSLQPGQGQYAAALTPKGRIVADVRIFAEEGSFLVDAPTRANEGWQAMVRKYVNPRLAPYGDETEELRDLGIFGVEARHVVAELTGVHASALSVLPPYSHVTTAIDGVRVLVAHVPDLEVDGYELFLPSDRFASLWERAVAAKAVPAGLDAFEIARVETGRPEYGIDIDESTIPQEANFDELHAISYTKGCYVGQEVVARVHFRGHVNKHLRGLRGANPEAPPTGALLFDAEGRQVGEVRSAVASPRLGGIALGIVRREIEPGATLTARSAEGESHLDVCALPFPS